MSGDIEHGQCEVCGKEGEVTRTYFTISVNCSCCIDGHHKMVRHCVSCKPPLPRTLTIHVDAENWTEVVEGSNRYTYVPK